jgi:hypothetical protein
MDVTIPHSRHENLDMSGFEMAERFDEVLDKADMFDFVACDDNTSILNGCSPSWDQEVGRHGVHFISRRRVAMIYISDGRIILNMRPVIVNIGRHV